MDAIYEMIAAPPKKTMWGETPTKIDVGEAETQQSSQEQSSQQEQPLTEETHPGETDDGSYLPKPDARQSPNFETSSEKDREEDEDMGKSMVGLASELGIESERTDDEDEEETGPRTKRADQNTHQADASAKQKKTTHQPRRIQKNKH